jgi:predicted ester cyclase
MLIRTAGMEQVNKASCARETFPDLNYTVDDIIAEGDK